MSSNIPEVKQDHKMVDGSMRTFWTFNGMRYQTKEAATNARLSALRYQGQAQQTLTDNEAARQAALYAGKAQQEYEQKQQILSSNEAARQAASYTGKAEQAYYTSSGSSTGSSYTPKAPAPPTKQQIENALNASYIKAIDKAIAGNATDLKALDMKTFGSYRPEGGYSKEFLTKQRKALSQGLSVSQYDQIEQAIYGNYVAAIDKALAGDFTDLKALDIKMGGPRSQEGYSKEFLTKQRAASALGVSVAEYDKRMQASDTKPVVAASAPAVPVATAKVSTPNTESSEETELQTKASDDPVEIDNKKVPEPGFVLNEKREDALAGDQGNSEEHRKDKEAHSKALAAQAEAEAKQEQALAVATANKQSAKEERLKKIMEMRKPYMGGAASVNGSSDAMVVPPIVPASQVPPPPLP